MQPTVGLQENNLLWRNCPLRWSCRRCNLGATSWAVPGRARQGTARGWCPYMRRGRWRGWRRYTASSCLEASSPPSLAELTPSETQSQRRIQYSIYNIANRQSCCSRSEIKSNVEKASAVRAECQQTARNSVAAVRVHSCHGVAYASRRALISATNTVNNGKNNYLTYFICSDQRQKKLNNYYSLVLSSAKLSLTKNPILQAYLENFLYGININNNVSLYFIFIQANNIYNNIYPITYIFIS